MIFLSTGCFQHAIAQEPTKNQNSQATKQSEQILRDKTAQERQRDIEKKKSENNPPIKSAKPILPSTGKLEDACRQISTINIKGITLLDTDDVITIIEPYQGTCLGVDELNTILKKITYLYIEKGYVTSRALLPEQDLTDSILEIIVLEGFLEQIIIDNQVDKHQSQIDSAFPNLIGQILNLRDIEQGLDQINRLSSNHAKINLIAGDKTGSTKLAVLRNQSDFFHGVVTSDNLGSDTTGRNQIRLTLNFDDLYGHNDAWGLSYQRTSINHPLFFSKDQYSEYISITTSFPYGYWLFDFSTSLSTYSTTVQGSFETIISSGNSRNNKLGVSVVAQRDQTSILKLSANLTWKKSENYIFSYKLDTSSRTITTASLELYHTLYLSTGQFITSISYNQGLPLFNANKDESDQYSPKSQFKSISIVLNSATTFPIDDITSTFNWQFTAQYSPDLLFGSEQVGYGSYSTVRGIRESVLFGNSGMLMRNDLSFRQQPFQDPDTTQIIGIAEYYTSLDFGLIPKQGIYQTQQETLTGFTLGVRFLGGIFSMDISYSEIINHSPNITDRITNTSVFNIITNVSF